MPFSLRASIIALALVATACGDDVDTPGTDGSSASTTETSVDVVYPLPADATLEIAEPFTRDDGPDACAESASFVISGVDIAEVQAFYETDEAGLGYDVAIGADGDGIELTLTDPTNAGFTGTITIAPDGDAVAIGQRLRISKSGDAAQ